ncbi:hypothetical protein KM043_000414 [Ampulex compressa]|nr:hypothetical protein KM043_000414 [Ampulex compressa]
MPVAEWPVASGQWPVASGQVIPYESGVGEKLYARKVRRLRLNSRTLGRDSSRGKFNDRTTFCSPPSGVHRPTKEAMKGPLVFVLVGMGLASAQLNYEGSPLTENTEYAAEESRASSRAPLLAPAGSPSRASNLPRERPREPRPAVERSEGLEADEGTPPRGLDSRELERASANLVESASSAAAARPPTSSPYVEKEPTGMGRSAHAALETFLNSRTPEESRLSLERYLHTRRTKDERSGVPEDSALFGEVASPERQSEAARLEGRDGALVHRETPSRSSILAAHDPRRVQAFSRLYESQVYEPGQAVAGQRHPQTLSEAAEWAEGQATHPMQPGQATMPMMHAALPALAIEARGDFAPIAWRTRRVRRPMPLPQPRLSPGLYKPTFPVPAKPGGPVELIYTRPPGFHVRDPAPSTFGHPPGPWFVDAESGYPPRTKDILYSQLYAQSYDPHYYNYIGKTGKIKPHLYGQLGKHRGEEEGGIWTELYRSFTKHGLKNIMTPGFLLGMTLPVVTLMLTALVQKRSFGRSDSRSLSREEAILLEYLERLQGAMECYERKTRKGQEFGLDDC